MIAALAKSLDILGRLSPVRPGISYHVMPQGPLPCFSGFGYQAGRSVSFRALLAISVAENPRSASCSISFNTGCAVTLLKRSSSCIDIHRHIPFNFRELLNKFMSAHSAWFIQKRPARMPARIAIRSGHDRGRNSYSQVQVLRHFGMNSIHSFTNVTVCFPHARFCRHGPTVPFSFWGRAS